MAGKKDYRLLNNSRFYVLAFSFLLSILAFSWLRIQITSDQLFLIRAQQTFGLLSVTYWYLALSISPLGYVIGKHRTKYLEFARRGIGVSAFYFALLHGSIALWGQLGGLSQIQYLPTLFRWSLLCGLVAFIVLLILAATSLDKVIDFMTFKRWKLLHRLIYLGGILAVLHIWTIGTHLAYNGVQLAAFFALLILGGLELFRVVKLINDKHLHLPTMERSVLFVSTWLAFIFLLLMMPSFVQNYHSRHDDHQHSGVQR